MASKKRPAVTLDDQQELAFKALEAKLERESDWSALDQFDQLGSLVDCLGPVDAGFMIRSSDKGRARSIGVFAGGRSQWTTCRDDRELLEMLRAAVEALMAMSGSKRAPAPKAKAKRS